MRYYYSKYYYWWDKLIFKNYKYTAGLIPAVFFYHIGDSNIYVSVDSETILSYRKFKNFLTAILWDTLINQYSSNIQFFINEIGGRVVVY
jgi:hypothetical protein